VVTSNDSWYQKLYKWLLHWAETPYGLWVLFFWAMAESSFFPIPPDAFLIAMVLGARKKAFRFALVASVGSIIGGTLGYAIGYQLWWSEPQVFSGLAHFFFNHVPGFSIEQFLDVQRLYEQWNFWVVFTAGFTPIPYKVITISAGAFNINFVIFVVASTVSRAARFYLVAWLLWKFGRPINTFIEKYLGWLSIAFVVLLIGGFMLINYVL